MNEKYLVVVDGLDGYCGIDLYFVGLFDTEEMANNAVDESIKKAEENNIGFIGLTDFKVIKIDVNNIHDIKLFDNYCFGTDIWIDGYEE